MQAIQEQIQEWKAKYGDVYEIEIDGRYAYLKTPDRKTLSYASSFATKDPIKFNETILNNCFIGGDEEIKKDDTLFLGVCEKLPELIQVKEATLKKL